MAFEYRGKRDAARWRRTWDVLLTAGSLLAPLLIGVALAGLLHGLPINSAQNFTGSFWDLTQPYALFTGITLVLVCLLHGATFLCLKTTGGMRERSWQVARRPRGEAERAPALKPSGLPARHTIALGTFTRLG